MTNPSDRASHSMSVYQHSAGARTRNVINIAEPGSTTRKAYSFSSTNSAPSSATDGYPNFRSQKTLHIVVENGRNGECVLEFYFYNSSLGGVWAPMSIPVRKHDDNGTEYADLPKLTIAASKNRHIIIPIEGIERFAVHASSVGGSSGACKVYMGVNTI